MFSQSLLIQSHTLFRQTMHTSTLYYQVVRDHEIIKNTNTAWPAWQFSQLSPDTFNILLIKIHCVALDIVCCYSKDQQLRQQIVSVFQSMHISQWSSILCRNARLGPRAYLEQWCLSWWYERDCFQGSTMSKRLRVAFHQDITQTLKYINVLLLFLSLVQGYRSRKRLLRKENAGGNIFSVSFQHTVLAVQSTAFRYPKICWKNPVNRYCDSASCQTWSASYNLQFYIIIWSWCHGGILVTHMIGHVWRDGITSLAFPLL